MQQFAFDGAVVEHVHLVRTQAHHLAEIRIAGEHRRTPAFITALEHLTQHAIQARQFRFLAKAFAIGRIHHHQAGMLDVLAATIREITPLDVHQPGEPGLLHIGQCHPHRSRVVIVTANRWHIFYSGGAPCACLGQQRLPDGGIVSVPTQKSIVGPVEAGCAVTGNERRFNRQGTGAAHQVHKRPARFGSRRPAGAQQNGGGKIFLERSRHRVHAITAPVQTLAGKIDTERCDIRVHIHIDTHIRFIGRYRRPHTGTFAKLIDNRVLDLECTVMGVRDRGTVGVELHCQGSVLIEMRGPINATHAVIKRLRCRCRKLGKWQQYAIGDPRPQTNPVSECQIAAERHPGARFFDIPGAERTQLIGQ